MNLERERFQENWHHWEFLTGEMVLYFAKCTNTLKNWDKVFFNIRRATTANFLDNGVQCNLPVYKNHPQTENESSRAFAVHFLQKSCIEKFCFLIPYNALDNPKNNSWMPATIHWFWVVIPLVFAFLSYRSSTQPYSLLRIQHFLVTPAPLPE